ncbi:MAG TPA: bile acid:sodium symporter [Steroidobacter sp.]|uniref:bile acid:sodium symporter n=1 Tax=Steroidobacter sp. TaxID=1978227 RepID=UPI002EDA8A96
MSIQTLVMLGLTLSIFLTVLTIGMRVLPADLSCVLSRPSRLIRSLLAMNVLWPLVAVIVCKTFSLHPAVIVGLVTLSIAPVGAMFSKAMLPLIAPDNPAYARGLFFASTVLSVILTPVAVEVIQRLFGDGEIVHVSPLTVIRVLVSSVLLPLGLGLALAHWRPEARRWVPAMQKVSGLVLLACAVPILVAAWPVMTSIVREGTLTAIALMTLAGLAIGHFLGGPGADDRTVLAFATVSRHPGVAVAVATLTDERLAPIGVLLAVLVSELAVVPYKLWRKRRRAAVGTAGHGQPPARAH